MSSRGFAAPSLEGRILRPSSGGGGSWAVREDWKAMRFDLLRYLTFRFTRGTKPPPFNPNKPGDIWDLESFSKACNVSQRTVENWRQGRRTPSRGNYPFIEEAFFGDIPVYGDDVYEEWRYHFRLAYKIL